MVEIPKNFLVFGKFTADGVQTLHAAESLKDAFSALLVLPRNEIRAEILLDFYSNLFLFSQESGFSAEKTSCLLEILDFLLTKLLSEQVSNEECFECFKQLLLKHSIERSPYSVAIFTLKDVKTITEYCLHTFFRHYSLYDYVFNPKKDLTLASASRLEGTLPVAPPLQNGKEIDPQELQVLAKYMPQEETHGEERTQLTLDVVQSEEEEQPAEQDPAQLYFKQQMATLKSEMEELIAQQDQELHSKLAAIKK